MKGTDFFRVRLARLGYSGKETEKKSLALSRFKEFPSPAPELLWLPGTPY